MAENIVSKTIYLAVFIALLALLALTIAAAEISHGMLNVAVAMLIATFKAALISLCFMHLWYSSALVRLFALAGFVWLSILIGMMMNDYVMRGPAAMVSGNG